ncbi:Hypp2058 [Branchiostoma lanceolatum]|uniref:Hypp2058 protein n=1 Tax=Branchiostoma lanceolatum TaxID=7740 RepID=A0A8J9ZNB8_BRALA|nr:Hypp2058 [Branchiostoma lanceolatum]
MVYLARRVIIYQQARTGTGVTGPAVLEMVPPRLPRTPPVENKLSQKKNVGILSFHPFHLSRGATNSAAKVKEAGAFPGPNVASSSKGAEHTDYAYEHYPPDITKDPGSDHEYEYLP